MASGFDFFFNGLIINRDEKGTKLVQYGEKIEGGMVVCILIINRDEKGTKSVKKGE